MGLTMPLRHACLCLGLFWVGVSPLRAAGPEDAATPALRLWQQGQDALRDGAVERAVGLYQQSMKLDPALARNYLSLAAGFVALGQDERAATYLAHYVEVQPEHLVARSHFAEM